MDKFSRPGTSWITEASLKFSEGIEEIKTLKNKIKKEKKIKRVPKKHILYHCEKCNCCIAKRGNHEQTKECENLRTRICKYCGLTFTSGSYETHEQLHAKNKNLKLKNFKLLDIITGEPIRLPPPDYYQCERCAIRFLTPITPKHVCSRVKYQTCNICLQMFQVQAHKLHIAFHDHFDEDRSPEEVEDKIINPRNIVRGLPKVKTAGNLNHKSTDSVPIVKRSKEIKMAIISEKHPKEKLRNNLIVPIRNMIRNLLFNATNEGINDNNLPRIKPEENLNDGVLYVACKDVRSTQLLMELNEVIIDKFKLKVVNPKDIPEPVHMCWKSCNFSNSVDENILFLQAFNKGLKTGEWQVLEAQNINGCIECIVVMDQISADVIRKAGYKLEHGMGTDFFQLLKNTV